MKRGFILAILSLFIVITFGGFGVPEKGHAAVTKTDLDKVISNFNDTVSNIQNVNSDDKKTLANLFKYIAINDFYGGKKPNSNLDGILVGSDSITYSISSLEQKNSIKLTDLPNLTFLGLESAVLNDYSSYLGTSMPTGTDFAELTDATNKYITALYALKFQTANALAVEQGKLSPQQAQIDNATAVANGQTLQNLSNKTLPEELNCTNLIVSPFINCITAGISWFIQNTLLTIGGWFLTMGGFLLDWSITSGIRDFNQWVPNGITGLWKLVRDVLYLCIVFIGFYLAFMYIIGRDEKFKKFVPWLIIFALFVNFSLPITKAMIDMTNIVALNIYNSAVPASTTGQSAGTAIMEKLDLSKLLSSTSTKNPSIAVSLLSVIFVFFAAWVFFQIAILMMVRTVTLTLCLIASPFLLIDAMVTVPAFGEHVKKIRSIFFNQLFMADVFMIIFFITLQVMNVLKPKEAITNAALAGTGVGNVGLIFGIFMMMILLHFMMKITKSMSGEVGGLATGVVNSGVGMFAGGAMGLSAMGGRATLGRLAAKARDSSWVKNNQDSFLGRKAYDFSHSVANSSMDARNTTVAQKFSSKTGMGLGKGGNMGYQQELDNTIKDRADRYQRMGVHQKNVFNENGTLKYKKGDADNRVETIAAKEEYYNKAGGVIGKTKEEKEEIKQSLERNRKTEAEKSLSEYTKLEGQEKKEHFDKQDTKTKELLLKSDISEGRKDDERKDQKEFNKSSVTAQQDLAKAMKDFVKQKETAETQPSNSSTSNNFATDIKNTKKNEDTTIGRGGKTDEKTTASGIILPS